MSFPEVLAELPALSVAERQILVRRALDLDDPGLSAEDEALVEERLAAHHRDPSSALSLEEMRARLRNASHNELAG
jgi:putative addiction module component (TIGR02574 family)